MFAKHFSLSLLLCALTVMAFITSCKTECDEPDVDGINALYLQFAIDGAAGSFSPSELDDVYMVRFQEAPFDSFNFPVDTLNLSALGLLEGGNRLRISRNIPDFGIEGPPYYTSFKYRFHSYSDDWEVRLQSINLEGSYTDDEECDYENFSKTFFLNSDSIDATASTSYVLMRKG